MLARSKNSNSPGRKASTKRITTTWFYNVKGTKGRGVIACEHITNDDGDEEIISAELKLPDGRTFILTIDP